MREDEGLDRISAMFAEESAALRKRTLWLSLVPIAVGAAVVVVAYLGVADARERRDLLLADIDELLVQQQQLNEEVEQQKAVAQHLQRKLPAAERNAAELVQTGLDAYNDSNYEVAIEKLEAAVASDPSMAEAHYRLGLSLWRVGKEDEALKQVQTAFELNPEYEARARQDRRFKELWDYSEFVEGERSAVDTGEATAIKQALESAKSGRFEQAVGAYDQALEVNPENAKVLGWKGYALYKQGDHEGAIENYKRCVEVDPERAECYYNMGLAFWAMGDRRRAQAAFERTWKLDPGFEAKARQDPAYRKILLQLEPQRSGRRDRSDR